MSYLTFHLLFILPPILGLALTLPRPLAGQGGWRARWGLPLIGLIAFVYTTPWDNFLVYHNVWSYGADRVLGTVGYVPLEEYAFFVLQPLLTGLFFYQLLARHETLSPEGEPVAHPTARVTGTVFFLALSVTGGILLYTGWERGLYAGLILTWAGPVLTVLWAFVGNVAWHLRNVFVLGVLAPTIYLWCADAIALRLGIWHITDATSLGAGLFGLPVEEAAFFLLTNLLVGLGLLLWLFSERAAGAVLFQHLFGSSHSLPSP